ncbi:MAG: TIM barrel protein [Candidatus Omnitrophica bacterium]|nr:TIM barrel protein [Candidatus Omnitrophota bacterium]
MNCYLSSSCFAGQSMQEVLKTCESEGIYDIEWSAPHTFISVDEINKLLKSYKVKGFSFVPHNYFPPRREDFVLNIATADERVRNLSLEMIKDMLDVASAQAMPVYGIHAGYLADPVVGSNGMFGFPSKTIKPEKAFINAVKFIEQIKPWFQQAGVQLALENLFPLPDGEFSLYCSFDEIKDMTQAVGDDVGLLLDLGHLNVTSQLRGIPRNKFIAKYLSEFGSVVHEVHLSENNGYKDEHLPVQENSWQLDIIREVETIKLRDGGRRCYCLEARNSDGIDVLKESMKHISKQFLQSHEGIQGLRKMNGSFK